MNSFIGLNKNSNQNQQSSSRSSGSSLPNNPMTDSVKENIILRRLNNELNEILMSQGEEIPQNYIVNNECECIPDDKIAENMTHRISIFDCNLEAQSNSPLTMSRHSNSQSNTPNMSEHNLTLYFGETPPLAPKNNNLKIKHARPSFLTNNYDNDNNDNDWNTIVSYDGEFADETDEDEKYYLVGNGEGQTNECNDNNHHQTHGEECDKNDIDIDDYDDNVNRHKKKRNAIDNSVHKSVETNDGKPTNTTTSNTSDKHKKLTYKDVEVIVSKYYEINNNNFSNEFNLIATFLKGQKNLYSQSKKLNEHILNFYDIVILIFTAGVAIFSPFIYHYEWSVYVFSSINAIITILYSAVKLLNLDASINFFMLLSNQYDKMQTSMELTVNKLTYLKNENHKNKLIVHKIDEVESKIIELKDTYPILIPNFTKKLMPVISHLNVFVFIKKVQNYKTSLIVNLKNVKNEIRYIYHKWGGSMNGSPPSLEIMRVKKRLIFLMKIKENIKNDIISYKNAYNYIDQIFAEEIMQSENFYNWILVFFGFNIHDYTQNINNPVVCDTLKHILPSTKHPHDT